MVHPVMKVEQRKKEAKSFMAVELSKLENGTVHIERDVPLDWLRKRMQFCEYEARPASAKLRLEINQMETGVLVRGQVSAVIQTNCGACLKEIVIRMEPSLSTYLLPRSAVEREIQEKALTPEDLDREYYEGDTIVLDDLIGDVIMLEMPMNPKCGDKCPGFSAANSAPGSSNIDPRLAPLAGIRINKEN
jgi:uncharacterized metal-binding protein YceD (DUF177 family)